MKFPKNAQRSKNIDDRRNETAADARRRATAVKRKRRLQHKSAAVKAAGDGLRMAPSIGHKPDPKTNTRAYVKGFFTEAASVGGLKMSKKIRKRTKRGN